MENTESSDTESKAVEVKVEDTNPNAPPAPFSAAQTKLLLWKLDWNIVPFLALLYLYVVTILLGLLGKHTDFSSLSFLDRSNIGNAKLFGLQQSLHMPTEGPKAIEYNAALAIFFPLYVAAEIPSNMMMKRLRPSLWLSIIMV